MAVPGRAEVESAVRLVSGECDRLMAEINTDELSAVAQALLRTQRLLFTGSGRSRLSASSVAMRLMHIGWECFVAGEVATPAITGDDLLVAVSGSGSGPVLEHLRTAQRVGAGTVLMTATRDSAGASLANTVLLLPARNLHPGTRQYAGSLFEQGVLLAGDALCHALLEARGVEFSDLDRRHANLA